MSTLTPEALLTQLRWRYAVKKFDTARKIPANIWSALEESLVLTPSSYGLQPWKFFVVDNPAIRLALLPHSWGQKQIVDSSHLVVFAVKKDVGPADAARHVERTAMIRGVSAESMAGYKNMMSGSLTRSTPPEVDTWMSYQVFIALGVFLSACAMLGIDSCPMEGFVPAKYDEVLGLTEKGYASRIVAAVGYRAADDSAAMAAKVRFPTAEIIERIG